MNVLLIINKPERELSIMQKLKNQILLHDADAVVDMLNFSDPDLLIRTIDFSPNVIVIFPFSAYPIAYQFYLIKFALDCQIVCFRTEGVLSFESEQYVNRFIGFDKYGSTLVDYQLEWGEKASSIVADCLLKQGKISSTDRVIAFGYPNYEIYFNGDSFGKFVAHEKIRHLIANYPRERVLFFVTGFAFGDYEKDDIIRAGDLIDVTDKHQFQTALDKRVSDAKKCAIFRGLWIRYITDTARNNPEVLIIVKSHPTENNIRNESGVDHYESFNTFANIIYISEDADLSEIMPFCGIFFHYGSTSATEAYFLKVPSVLIASEFIASDDIVLPVTEIIDITELPIFVQNHLKSPLKFQHFDEMEAILDGAFNIKRKHLCGEAIYQPSKEIASFLVSLKNKSAQNIYSSDPHFITVIERYHSGLNKIFEYLLAGGTRSFKEQNFQSSLSYFMKMIDISKISGIVLSNINYNIALCYYLLGNLHTAQTALMVELAVNPSHVEGLELLKKIEESECKAIIKEDEYQIFNSSQLGPSDNRKISEPALRTQTAECCLTEISNSGVSEDYSSRVQKFNEFTPRIFMIESTLACNLRCPECAIGGKLISRKHEMMSFNRFKVLADKIRPYAQFLYPYIWGEPTLNPDIIPILRYASTFTKTNISTNGMTMTEILAEELITSGVSSIIVSIDGLSQDVYGRYRIGGDVQKAWTALELLQRCNLKHGTRVALTPQYIVFSHNQHEMEPFAEKCRDIGLEPAFKAPYLRETSRFEYSDHSEYIRTHYPTEDALKNAMRDCPDARFTFTILVDGSVVACCYDHDNATVFGNLFEQDVDEIWNSPRYRQFRWDMLSGNAPHYCTENCLAYYKGSPERHRSTAENATQGGDIICPETCNLAQSEDSSVGISMTRKKNTDFPLDDLNAAVNYARELFNRNDYLSVFDLYERLVDFWPNHAIPLLAEVYDLYAALPDKENRYLLYQSRHFDFKIRPGDKVLDVGSGHIPFPFATHLTDISVNDDSVGRAGTPFKHLDGIPVYECNVENMPFSDKEFDFVYCSHVLEHTNNPEAACRELMRVGKRGYIETPSRGKDVWLNMAKTSNHRWAVEWVNETLIFTEYTPEEKEGLGSDILMSMHCSPQTPREKAFSALIYLKAPQVNTMLCWNDSFRFEVRHCISAPDLDGVDQGNATWQETMNSPSVKLYAGDIPEMEQYIGWVGLSISKGDNRHILHDITRPFPIPDNSVDAFQAEDVLEHIPYDQLLPVLNEIFRVLKPNALFRLSVPDYGCDVLQERSIKDSSGKIVFDPGGGGTVECPGHVWFPRIDNVRKLINKSLFAAFGRVDYLHYYNMDGSFIVKPVDYAKGHVDRTPDHDDRVMSPYRPMSMIIDLVKAARESCLFINTYYGAFLSKAYSQYSDLGDKPYKEQLQRLVDCHFGDSDFYSGRLKEAGWNADDLIVNCEPLQLAWARENETSYEGQGLVVEQIKLAKPDCIYLQNLGLGTKEFLSAIRPYTTLILGQIAYPLLEQADLSGFDIIFSSFPHFVDRFRAAGITAYYQPLAFEPRILKSVTKFAFSQRPVECSFVGGISPMHGKGYQLLEKLATHVPIDFWGYGTDTLPPDSAIRARHHGEVWGTEMFYLLGASKITINRHIDVAENYANNMRLFEATGCGALLITDYKDNLSELFEIGKEVVVYRSPEECIELVRYYLAHSDEAEKIAKAGQARTLRDHTYEIRMKQTAKVLSRHLRYRREQVMMVMPERISDGYRAIEIGQVTPALEAAWKNPDLPLQQRALVQQQLLEMYKGNTPHPFTVLSGLLSPIVLEGASILEIGCASGYNYEVLEYLLKRQLDYTGVDYSSAMIDMGKDYYPEASFLIADGACLPIADREFRVVISGCVLLHTPDYAAHIAETARVAEQWIVVHRTPVCKVRQTICSSKMAYGVETVEFRFNEQELLSHFTRNGFILQQSVTYEDRPESDEYEVSYLLERSAPTSCVPQPQITPRAKLPSNYISHKGPVVLVSRAIAFTFPLSYAYLAGQLRSQGEDVRVLFKDIPPHALVKQIMDLNPLIVGFGNLYPELAEIRVLIRMLDDAGRTFPVVIGGQMVSPTPEFAVRITGADFGVIGEGELILGELVKRLRNGQDVSDLKGLVIRDGAYIQNNGPGAFIENLSSGLPSIPYELFPTEQWLPIGEWYAKNLPVPHWKIDDRVINVHGGRGCPFTCNFCYHHSKARYRDITVMMDEAQEALIRFNGNMLYFSDDLVMANPKRARELIEAIGKLDRPVSFQISTRFDILARMDDEILRDLKRAGCRSMGLGLESGSDRILKIIGKNCTAQQIEEGLERLRLVGIYPTTSIMLGQYTETLEDAVASIALMQRTVQKDPYLNYAFTLTTPFPGSALYDLIFQKGLLKDDQEFYDRYFSSAGEFKQVVNLSSMSDTEVTSAFYEIQRIYDIEKRKANVLLGIC